MRILAKRMGYSPGRFNPERYAHLAPGALLAPAARLDLSTIYPLSSKLIAVNPQNHSAPPAGIGPATFGLGSRCQTEQFSQVTSENGWIVDRSQHAVDALAAIAMGGPDAAGKVTEILSAIAKTPDPHAPRRHPSAGDRRACRDGRWRSSRMAKGDRSIGSARQDEEPTRPRRGAPSDWHSALSLEGVLFRRTSRP